MKMAESSPNGLGKKKKKTHTHTHTHTVGKGEIAHYKHFFFSPHGVFKRLVLQTRTNQGLFWKVLIFCLSEDDSVL